MITKLDVAMLKKLLSETSHKELHQMVMKFYEENEEELQLLERLIEEEEVDSEKLTILLTSFFSMFSFLESRAAYLVAQELRSELSELKEQISQI